MPIYHFDIDEIPPELGTPADAVFNMRAIMAARGAARDPELELAKILRSEFDLWPELRRLIADALEGKAEGGIRLRFSGHKKARDKHVGGKSRKKWVKVGEWVQREIESGRSRHDALAAASSKFAFSYEGCDKALAYYARVSRWLNAYLRANPDSRYREHDYLVGWFIICEERGAPIDEADDPFNLNGHIASLSR